MLLQRKVKAKSEMRKAMLSGYMQALDESEGLQQTITRLADCMGVGEDLMHIVEFAELGTHGISSKQGFFLYIVAIFPNRLNKSAIFPNYPERFAIGQQIVRYQAFKGTPFTGELQCRSILLAV